MQVGRMEYAPDYRSSVADILRLRHNQPPFERHSPTNPTTLADLIGKLTYIASPYTNYPYGHAAAAYDAARVTAALMRMGICAVSPIAHSHAVAHVGGLDKVDGEFWQRMDAPLVRAAEACIVVKLPGWDTSKGVTHEIAEFERAGKPIVYLDDGEVG